MAMDISGECRIPAKVQQVWEALNDPAVLASSIAGCKQLDKVSDTEFSAIVVVKVGAISATFRGNVVLSDLDPPHGYTLSGQGQGGAAGFARMSAKVMLEADGDHTILKYVAEATIGGKLASVGSRLVQSVAKKNADDFFAAFARHFGAAEIADVAQHKPQGKARAASPSLAAPVYQGSFVQHPSTAPAWLVVFSCAVGFALGYMVGHVF